MVGVSPISLWLKIKVGGVITLGSVLSDAVATLVEGNTGTLVAGLVATTGIVVVVVVDTSVLVVAGSVGSTHVEVCGIGSVVGAAWVVVVVVSAVVAGGSVVEVDDASGRDEVVVG